jgi:hypothetical protein
LFRSEDAPYGWNLFGEEFTVLNDVTVSLQDVSSKINIRYPNSDRLKAFLLSLEMSQEQTDEFMVRLFDYQDLDRLSRLGGREPLTNRNGPMSDLSEIRNLGLKPSVESKLMDNASLFRVGSFNSINARFELLVALYGEEIANEIVAIRSHGGFSKHEFINVTGIKEQGDVFLYPSNDLEIILQSTVDGAVVKQTWTVLFKPYAVGAAQPYLVVSKKEL